LPPATSEADRAAAEAIGRLFDPDRIERPDVAHIARDGTEPRDLAGSPRDAGAPRADTEEAAGG